MKTNRHISDTDIEFFRSGALSAEDTVLCAEHIEVCTECDQRLDRLLLTDNRSRPVILDFSPKTYLTAVHLDYEQLSDYLEEKLDRDEAEIVRIHVELCPRCRKDLLSLTEFRLLVEPELKIRYSPPSRLKSLIELLKLPRSKSLAFAYATLLILCISGYLLTTIYFRRDPKSTQDDIVRVDDQPSAKGKDEPPPLSKSTGESRKMNSSRRPKHDKAKEVYDNGRWYGLDNKSNPVELRAIPSDLREDVSALLRGQDIYTPALLNELKSSEPSERGTVDSKSGLVLISPVRTLIKKDRPSFRWRPVSGATSYVIEIVDDAFIPVVKSPNLTIAGWSITFPLERDKVYLWQVTAFKDGEMIEGQVRQTGKFKIVSASKLGEIENARRKYSSHTALGVFYFKEGLLEEADREFQELLRKNPDSKLAQNIFRKIRLRLNNNRSN